MHENFITMDRDKRDRIINAAMCEFAARGFKNASTNEIVKNAHISKGALFHYFASKQDLFAFLFRYSVDLFIATAEPRIKDLPTDVFDRWMAFAALKIEMAAQYPNMAAFMQTVYQEDLPELIVLMREELDRFSAMLLHKVYEGIDVSKFKPDVDVQKVLQMIWWITEGFTLAKQREKTKQPAQQVQPAQAVQSEQPAQPAPSALKTDALIAALASEIKGYLDMLKKAFYREDA